jgi:hypothetical protein
MGKLTTFNCGRTGNGISRDRIKGLKIKWSQPQKDHRRDFSEASKYASAAVADPQIRAIYVQMAIERNKDPRRPSDIASSDYYHTGNDLLWKKHMGDQQKPGNWRMERYAWYSKKQK